MKKIRIIKIVIATILLACSCIFVYQSVIYPMIWERRMRDESIQILEAAKTASELAEVVGDLGIFISFPDDSWIAIRYRDSHAGWGLSSAVALDSNGEWLKSTHHFCGKLLAYSQMMERQGKMEQAMRELGETYSVDIPGGYEDIHRLATSPDLVSARNNLVAFEFKQIER